MRLFKSLFAIAAASTIAVAPAFADDSRPIERDYLTAEEFLVLEEAHGIAIYPVEVTEYYLIVPEGEDEMRTNG